MIAAIPPIPPIPAVGTPTPAAAAAGSTSSLAAASAASTAAPGVAPAGGGDFASTLGRALDQLQGVTSTADSTATAAATGQASLADLMVTSTQAQLETQLFTTVRDKAVTAYNQIIDMQA